jgi:AcrR family transcriptional regulator
MQISGAAAAANGEKEPRTARGRKTLQRLIDAAAAEFGERGFHDAAITGITRRAGVALGTFYTYFESKEEVFRALVKEMSRATRAHVAEAVKDAPDRLAAERMGLEAFIAFTRRHPELYRIIEEAQFVAHDAYREHYLTFADAYRRNLAAARERGQISPGSGHVDQTDEARAWALIGMSVFLGMRYGIWGKDLPPAEVARIAIELASEGLRKR